MKQQNQQHQIPQQSQQRQTCEQTQLSEGRVFTHGQWVGIKTGHTTFGAEAMGEIKQTLDEAALRTSLSHACVHLQAL